MLEDIFYFFIPMQASVFHYLQTTKEVNKVTYSAEYQSNMSAAKTSEQIVKNVHFGLPEKDSDVVCSSSYSYYHYQCDGIDDRVRANNYYYC